MIDTIDIIIDHIRTIFSFSDKFMPCLRMTKNIDNDSNLHKLKWEPNDFKIPSGVLVRSYERIDGL